MIHEPRLVADFSTRAAATRLRNNRRNRDIELSFANTTHTWGPALHGLRSWESNVGGYAEFANFGSRYMGPGKIYVDGITIVGLVRLRRLVTFDCLWSVWNESVGRYLACTLNNASGSLRGDTSNNGTFNANQVATTSNLVALGKWYVVATVHASNFKTQVYIDGVLQGESSNTAIANSHSQGVELRLGHAQRWGGATRASDIEFAAVRIYKGGLSGSRMSTISREFHTGSAFAEDFPTVGKAGAAPPATGDFPFNRYYNGMI